MADNCGDDRNNNVYRQRNGNGGGNWTNERHSNFLSLMEASFVRTMFEKNCINNIGNNNNNNNNNSVDYNPRRNSNSNNSNTSNNSRLDRFVPDIAESTRDLSSRNFTTTSGVVRVMDPVIIQRQRPQARPHKTPHDQVVPILKDRAAGKAEN